jgi:hypothetical protein
MAAGYMWIVSVYKDGVLVRKYTAMLHTVEDIFWHVQFNYGQLELDSAEEYNYAFSDYDASLSVVYQN